MVLAQELVEALGAIASGDDDVLSGGRLGGEGGVSHASGTS